MKILVLGAAGMLGSAVFRLFEGSRDFEVHGTVRKLGTQPFFRDSRSGRLHVGIDASHPDSLVGIMGLIRPDIVVNCVGIVKQLSEADDPLYAIPINSLLPHRLAMMCQLAEARLVHVSTDCVFSGTRGRYTEVDLPDATDLYGRSKLLGEVDYPGAVTIRTSIIGHELSGAHGLVEWFLSQEGRCQGYTRAVFSGLPTVILAEIIRDIVIPHSELHGVYHVSASPIDKFSLLRLIADAYEKSIDIVPDERVVVDRSLDSSRFTEATGYFAPGWPELIDRMRRFG